MGHGSGEIVFFSSLKLFGLGKLYK